MLDRKTGQITIVESKDPKSICGGALNTDCDPVNGIAIEPWIDKCAIIAVGLVHFMALGRIVEVCDHRIHPVYSREYGPDNKSTVPFFGIAAAGATLWAVGADGIYQIAPGGVEKVHSLPEFQKIGSVLVSFALPDVVLLLTNVNQRRSVSGSTPMIIAR